MHFFFKPRHGPLYLMLCFKEETEKNLSEWVSVMETKAKHGVIGGATLPGIGFLFTFLLASSLVYQDINE